MQTKIQSLIEALYNTTIAFFISWVAALIFYPMYGFNVTMITAFELTGIFTIISIVRGYIIRRFFNWFHNRDNNKAEYNEYCEHGDHHEYCPVCRH